MRSSMVCERGRGSCGCRTRSCRSAGDRLMGSEFAQRLNRAARALRESGLEARVRKASEIMRALRMRKDAEELARLREAGKVVDDTIPIAVSLCQAGQRECDVEVELRRALLARSPESSVAFSIVASGPN